LATTAMKYFTPEQAAIFEQLQHQCGEVKFGGDGYLYAQLASGKIDIVVEAGLKPYDFCALKPVVEGAGGVITDWDGKPLTVKSDGRVIAAASKELHVAALHVIS
jgi:inositol-phosphate phosphatase/L-galactose 1-phosphate phosphatase/histidinol-phosphatase